MLCIFLDEVTTPTVEATVKTEPTTPVPPSPPPKRVKHEDWLDDLLVVRVEPPTTDLIRVEIERYLADPFIKGSDTVLKWWGSRAQVYPHIASLAKKYLPIPASSVPSERIFSLAGNIVSPKRSLLKPENVDLLIFLKKNCQ